MSRGQNNEGYVASLNPRAEALARSAISALAAQGIQIAATSGHRDGGHNASVGGAKGSQHINGNALDFSIAHLTDPQKASVIAAFRNAGAVGFGIYTQGAAFTGSVHVDFRQGDPNSPVIWGHNGSYTNNGQGHAWLPGWAKQGLYGSPAAPSYATAANHDSSQGPFNAENGPWVAPLVGAAVNPFAAFTPSLSPPSGEQSSGHYGPTNISFPSIFSPTTLGELPSPETRLALLKDKGHTV